jgi:hypothetical protein
MVLGFASGLEWRQAITTFTQQAGKPPAIYQLFFDVEREDSITREQMAAFLARSFDLAPSGTDFFVDDRSSIFQSAIDKVARAGITLGCNPADNNRFCATDLVTRGHMAASLRRSLSG